MKPRIVESLAKTGTPYLFCQVRKKDENLHVQIPGKGFNKGYGAGFDIIVHPDILYYVDMGERPHYSLANQGNSYYATAQVACRDEYVLHFQIPDARYSINYLVPNRGTYLAFDITVDAQLWKWVKDMINKEDTDE